MSASGPAFVSLPGYSEIFTGRRAHGCADNDCGRARAATLFDEVARAEASPGAVAVFSSWERIERAASPEQGAFVLSAGRSVRWDTEELADDAGVAALLDQGSRADPYPGYGDFRPDRMTSAIALRYLEQRHPRLLYLGLGEPDEYAHRGDLPGYLASLRAADAAVGAIFETLDRMGDRGKRTTVLVTTDHGRGSDWRHHGRELPESARVWLFAAGEGIAARGLLRSYRTHHLSDVAPTVRALLEMPSDAAPSAGAPIDELFVGQVRMLVGATAERR
jgi:arylsulfatase A-like enzyme